MAYSLFLNVYLVVSFVILFLSLHLILRPMPEGLKKRPYYLSRKLMGYALSVLPLLFIFYYFFGLNDSDRSYGVILNIYGCYPTSGLMGISFLVLIGENVNLKSNNFMFYVASFIFFPALIYLGILYEGMEKMTTIVNTLLFSSILAQFIYFHIRFKDSKAIESHEYASDIKIHRIWIKKSLCVFIILATITCIMPLMFSFNKWLALFYLIGSLVCFVYIYDSYQRFVLEYQIASLDERDIDVDIDSSAKSTFLLSDDTYQLIHKQLGMWVSRKGYRKSGITISSVSADINTNRTYLSMYINSTYDCSFKTWITSLRIQDAKELLTKDYGLTVKDIAFMTGFSSQTSFIHVFRNSEGLPPAKWRINNRVVE